jgi:hypothetical protein
MKLIMSVSSERDDNLREEEMPTPRKIYFVEGCEIKAIGFYK